jgi:serine/threonine protein kinase
MPDSTPKQIGKYPIIREIGRGATSVVYLARDAFASREVAIKVIKNQPVEEADLKRRYRRVFLNEAALVGKLFHPHILVHLRRRQRRRPELHRDGVREGQDARGLLRGLHAAAHQ